MRGFKFTEKFEGGRDGVRFVVWFFVCFLDSVRREEKYKNGGKTEIVKI